MGGMNNTNDCQRERVARPTGNTSSMMASTDTVAYLFPILKYLSLIILMGNPNVLVYLTCPIVWVPTVPEI